MYKMFSNKVVLKFDDHFQLKRSSTRSKHDFIVTKKHCNSDLVRGSFFYKTIDDWNQLDRENFLVTSPDGFKLKVIKRLCDRSGIKAEPETGITSAITTDPNF